MSIEPAVPTATFNIDRRAVLDYTFDWSDWLAPAKTVDGVEITPAETIASFEVTITDGITLRSTSETGGMVTVWVSNAIPPTQKVTCSIITDQDREDRRHISLYVTDR